MNRPRSKMSQALQYIQKVAFGTRLFEKPPKFPCFQKLPSELTWIVYSMLELDDCIALRRTCRQFDNDFLGDAARRCFQIITTDLSKESLQSLQMMINNSSSDIVDHVHTLRIFSSIEPDQDFARYGEGYTWTTSISHRDKIILQGAQALENVILSLPNCRSFNLEHPEVFWRAYQQSSIISTLALPGLSNHILLGGVMCHLNSIIARHQLKVQGFHFLSRRQGLAQPRPRSIGDPISSGHILPNCWILPTMHNEKEFKHIRSILKEPSFRSAWAQVENLTLGVDAVVPYFGSNWVGAPNTVLVPSLLSIYRYLLIPITSLRSLNLSLGIYWTPESPSIMSVLNSRERCTSLSRLSLTHMSISGSSFLKLLQRCQGTLSHLQLKYVMLLSFHPGFDWGNIFDFLRLVPSSCLDSIDLGYLTQGCQQTRTDELLVFNKLTNRQNLWRRGPIPIQEARDFGISLTVYHRDLHIVNGSQPPKTKFPVTGVSYNGFDMNKVLSLIQRSRGIVPRP
ncbi:hypothetical protein BT63DRAFT_455890 [Microthyrium microscopicum]|uniref:F-box domain-containing protein n=1 Tax=Microthyrium microscopicum TaxID=703497 RepID=A0A6A6UBF7_9PEZI|nr:hypothetical protein BT63DRAFT_455890 [Microthyrium microscopicum]